MVRMHAADNGEQTLDSIFSRVVSSEHCIDALPVSVHCSNLSPETTVGIKRTRRGPASLLCVWGQLINYTWVKYHGSVGLLMALNDLQRHRNDPSSV